MNIPENILNSTLYKDIIVLAKTKGYTIHFEEYSDVSAEKEIGLGFTKVNNNVINIGILSSSLNEEIVFIHELLHAKSHLLGYPSIQHYSKIPLHPFLNEIFMSLQNIVHHTFVYREMKLLGRYQEEINNDYFKFLENEIQKNHEGVANLATVINLLDGYTRDPIRTGHIIGEVRESHDKELDLYFKMREIIVKCHSPLQMKVAFCKLIQIINDFIKKENNEDVHLNLLIKVDPIFQDDILRKKASDVLYTLKIKGYPHVFVMDRQFNQCCLFLSKNGNSLEQSLVDNALQQHTLKEFLN